MVNYDEYAMPGSLWEIITDYCEDKKIRDELFADVRRFRGSNYKLPQLFIDLNRTRYAHFRIDKDYNIALRKEMHGDKWIEKLPKGYFARKVVRKNTKYVVYKPIKYTGHTANTYKYIQWVKEFYAYYKIPLSVFDLTPEEQEHFDIFNFAFDLTAGDSPRDKRMFKVDYLNAFDPAIAKLSKKIYFYTYLEGFDQKHEMIANYNETRGKLFKIIEEKLQALPDLNYTHVIALPHRLEVLREDKRSTVIKKFLDYCSVELLLHICTGISCDFRNSTTSADGIPLGYYILNKCTRTYNCGVIDSYVSTEYQSYDNLGCSTEVLYVEKISEYFEQYMVIINAFKKIFKQDVYSIKENNDTMLGDANLFKIDDLDEIIRLLEQLIQENQSGDEMLNKKLMLVNQIRDNK